MENPLCLSCDGRGFTNSPVDPCRTCGGTGEEPAHRISATLIVAVIALLTFAVLTYVKAHMR